jgi:hypothetical protein
VVLAKDWVLQADDRPLKTGQFHDHLIYYYDSLLKMIVLSLLFTFKLLKTTNPLSNNLFLAFFKNSPIQGEPSFNSDQLPFYFADLFKLIHRL